MSNMTNVLQETEIVLSLEHQILSDFVDGARVIQLFLVLKVVSVFLSCHCCSPEFVSGDFPIPY